MWNSSSKGGSPCLRLHVFHNDFCNVLTRLEASGKSTASEASAARDTNSAPAKLRAECQAPS